MGYHSMSEEHIIPVEHYLLHDVLLVSIVLCTDILQPEIIEAICERSFPVWRAVCCYPERTSPVLVNNRYGYLCCHVITYYIPGIDDLEFSRGLCHYTH